MLWEEGREGGKWNGYFGKEISAFAETMSHYEFTTEGLPRTFETPMFWTDEELKQLEGTAVHGVV
jgi:hypothetical protein